MRIGVDVGGTNTDAVLMNGDVVISSCKMPTTKDVSSGIVAAIQTVLSAGSTDASDIKCVMIGTTHFTNAFVERKGLLEVAVIRVALPAARGIRPMIDWPGDIASCIGSHPYLIEGGYQYDGRINSKLDERAVAETAKSIKAKGLKAVAICGLFASVNSDMERRVSEILLNEAPELDITLSSTIGRVGLLERENAAIMNASLAQLSSTVVSSFKTALLKLEISAPFFISQNDGTLMNAEFVEKYPVLTFASGPTNSMRGAAYLTGKQHALVADIGGTTTDIGMLVKGFPRESAITADIGGVRTNFRMPDIFAIGLGGGSIVQTSPKLSIGPQSVGYRLLEDAQIFGGDILTASDIAVAAEYANFGDASRVMGLEKETVALAVDHIHRLVAEGVDRMKTNAGPIPLILVGGGASIIRDDIPGTSETIIPDNAGVANAIGASIAQVGGEVDKIYSYTELGRDNAIDLATKEAIANASAAGANEETVKTIEIEEVPLAYMPGGAVRLHIKVAGDLVLQDGGKK